MNWAREGRAVHLAPAWSRDQAGKVSHSLPRRNHTAEPGRRKHSPAPGRWSHFRCGSSRGSRSEAAAEAAMPAAKGAGNTDQVVHGKSPQTGHHGHTTRTAHRTGFAPVRPSQHAPPNQSALKFIRSALNMNECQPQREAHLHRIQSFKALLNKVLALTQPLRCAAVVAARPTHALPSTSKVQLALGHVRRHLTRQIGRQAAALPGGLRRRLARHFPALLRELAGVCRATGGLPRRAGRVSPPPGRAGANGPADLRALDAAARRSRTGSSPSACSVASAGVELYAGNLRGLMAQTSTSRNWG